MPTTVPIHKSLIQWATDRSGLPLEELGKGFPKLQKWLSGDDKPTFRQLERFAKKTMTPLGYLFLSNPPEEVLPIPDYRSIGDAPIDRPSPNLIATINEMQRRQNWMHEYLIDTKSDTISIVGSAKMAQPTEELANLIRDSLGFENNWANGHRTWHDALKEFRNRIEDLGILVCTSGIVGLNTHRKLDPNEFRGFVLTDDYAPLIFVNGSDSKSAQMFTLAHELVHIWLGEDGLFNLIESEPSSEAVEIFCNKVAAEFLIPQSVILDVWDRLQLTENPFNNLARRFKVSPLAAARRVLQLKLISKAEFFEFYKAYMKELDANLKNKKKGGGTFYPTQESRLGRNFSSAVISATDQGKLMHRDAYRLTGLTEKTFDSYSQFILAGKRV